MVAAGDFNPEGRRFDFWWKQVYFSLHIGDRNISVKWREYFGSHLFAAKIRGTMAGIKKLKCFVQLLLGTGSQRHMAEKFKET